MISSWMTDRSKHTLWAAAAGLAMFANAGATAAEINVITYHNDTLRTGWNSSENTLTPNVIGGGSFGLLQQVTLDEQVDAQPLLVTGLTIGGATHDVVYVATEGNSVYAIDASSGAILLHTTLGTPVAVKHLPGKCSFNGNVVGILSTPVIDLTSQALFVMAYVYTGSKEEFVLHALNLTTLADTISPVVVSASHKLSDGSTVYDFNAGVSHQRAALLEAGGSIYAGFASYCDLSANTSRGWLLGWKADTLEPLAQTALTNRVLPGNSPNDFFLTSIWMSGYGPASGGTAGNLFFVTGNADPSGTTYDSQGGINLSESVVEMSPTLSRVVSYFSPTDAGADVAALDQADRDFGAGGVMLLPTQPGSFPDLAVAAGKAGIMYFMNSTNLGGENSSNVLGEYSIGGCWCGPSYFTGADGVGRVVSSGGTRIMLWKVQTSPTTALIADPAFKVSSIKSGQSAGFFTSVSSNGTTSGSAVIWAIGRPFRTTHEITLYAFNAATGAQLFSDTAGTWPHANANANLVPTVANGKVYVGSYRMLSIFGVAGAGQALVSKSKFVYPAEPLDPIVSAHQISGFVRAISGGSIEIELRDGQRAIADIGEALRQHTAMRTVVGDPVLVRGDYDRDGILRAESVIRAKPQPELWPPDR